jgi:hypothetical protein
MDVSENSLAGVRRLGGALEPVIGSVYFAPEAHQEYVALGFDPSPGEMNGVAAPDGVAYFTSRGSLMGQVPGTVVASAFAVFNPAAVVPSVSAGWSRTDAPTIREARDRGALGQLLRVLGKAPDGLGEVEGLLNRAVARLDVTGRPLAAGVQALEPADHPLGALFRCGELLREFRGDSHTIAWVHAGFDATEIGLLTEAYWGLPPRSYARTRAWSDADFDAASERLRSRGLLEADGSMTPAGVDAREAVEVSTDAQMGPVATALGDHLERLIDLLTPWGQAVRDALGYPQSGPHDLAEAAAAPK